jgi:PAS domain S-box-containing protein
MTTDATLPTTSLEDENRRLAAELAAMRQEHQQAMALQEIQHLVLERIARGEPLAGVLDALVRLAEVETGMLGSVLLCEGDHLRHGAAPSLPAAYNEAIDGIAIGPGVGSCGTAAATGERTIVEDVATHPYWAPFKDLALSHELAACWSQPVVSASGEILGTFALYYRAPRAPEPYHLKLVELASHLAGIAIERERSKEAEARHLAELEQERAFASQVVQDLAGGVAYLDRELVFRVVNKTYAKVFDRRPEDFMGRGFLEVFPTAGDVEAIVRRVIATGEPFEMQGYAFTYHDEHGAHDTLWDYTLTAHRDGHGQIAGVVAFCAEVTERVKAERAVVAANEELTSQSEELQMQAEELNAANEEVHAVNEMLLQQTMELQAQQATMRGVLDSALSGILVGTSVRDRQGKITDFRFTLANPMCEKLLHFTREELVGYTLLERFPGNVEAGLFDLYVRVAETGEPEETESWYSDGRLDFWVSVCAVKVGDGVAITFTDISERKRAEAQLRQLAEDLQSQRRFAETLIDRLPAGVAFIDKDYRFQVVNPALERFYGIPADALVGKTVNEGLRGLDPAIDGLYAQVRETLEPLSVAGIPVNYLVEGVERLSHWDATIVPYLDQHGAFDGWLVLAWEVSERLQLQAERDALAMQRIADLEQANVHKEQFFGILSHELRTPINAIMGFASVLDDEVMGPLTASQHDYMGKILDGSDRLLALINDLLDMSRIQAGKFAISPGEVDLPALCHDALGALQPIADQHGVALTLSAPAVPLVQADRQRIEQVVTNLVSNAIKFTAAGGTVGIRIVDRDGIVRVEVEDTGIGISEEHQVRIFDAFTQVDMSNTRRSGGAGLGLAIAKSLVEAHGGRIGVRSTLGAGSTFWFSLPRP